MRSCQRLSRNVSNFASNVWQVVTVLEWSQRRAKLKKKNRREQAVEESAKRALLWAARGDGVPQRLESKF